MGGHTHHPRIPLSNKVPRPSRREPAVVARDLMQTKPLTISPDASLLSAHHVFVVAEIHGAPVVDDEEGKVVGVISTLDLLQAVQDLYESGAATATYFREDLPYSGPDWLQTPEDFQDRLNELRVGDIMTRELVTVKEDATVSEMARLMRQQRVHRVLVVQDGYLRGLVTTFDLLSQLEDLR